jgi:hypothetical protein
VRHLADLYCPLALVTCWQHHNWSVLPHLWSVLLLWLRSPCWPLVCTALTNWSVLPSGFGLLHI